MEIYLVGGAVRDSLLGKAIRERDWVVVGATVAELVALGYKKVGRDFPVFLHPVTHEEYALARIERKTGKGYTQFSFYTDPSVTLIEDLRRRDLTINAMARSMHGELIDPYGGEADLRNKVLRHVSPAFVEDPVRVLRVARFAAKFGDFVVHPSTMQMMRVVLLAGELDALVPERVWREWRLSLLEQNPEKFYSVLEGCGALAKLFPEFAKNFVLVSRVLKQVVCVSDDPLIRFAAVMGCLTEEEVLAVCKRYRVPKEYTQLGRLVARHRDFYQHILHTVYCSLTDFRDGSRQSNKAVSQSTVTEIDSSSLALQQGVSAVNKRSLLDINEHCEQGHNEAASQNTKSIGEVLLWLNSIDAYRRPQRLQQLLVTCEVVAQCIEMEDVTNDTIMISPRIKFLQRIYEAARGVNIKDLVDTGLQGEELREKIQELRLLAVRRLMS